MRILILGGTRFHGKQVASLLITSGHEVVILSRRYASFPESVVQICKDRSAGLMELTGERFDVVLDFICHSGEEPAEVARSIGFGVYVLISSTWIPRLWGGRRADELRSEIVTGGKSLLPATIRYLTGKVQAEYALAELRSLGLNAITLRLPIILGEGDHTGRYAFYSDRFADGGPVILVDGGRNHVQIAVMEDLAKALVSWLGKIDVCRYTIWEALPGNGMAVRDILSSFKGGKGKNEYLIEVPIPEILSAIPEYLNQEPFWKESSMLLSNANIFSALGLLPEVFGFTGAATIRADRIISKIRMKELKFLENRKAH
jgi:nucleoside-diphosphate-sugar epimerase